MANSILRQSSTDIARQVDAGAFSATPAVDLLARQCRGCGCTDDEPCAGGCFWVAADLCSTCAGE